MVLLMNSNNTNETLHTMLCNAMLWQELHGVQVQLGCNVPFVYFSFVSAYVTQVNLDYSALYFGWQFLTFFLLFGSPNKHKET